MEIDLNPAHHYLYGLLEEALYYKTVYGWVSEDLLNEMSFYLGFDA